ncbi:tRNA uridine-5-carboxymethylaminomethyl(34) synthesis GTPase MnmE [Pseudaestuariivita atlantica]|uniref:tRNA modification GTPase MnmE n=1 Tax=Pseudaestuariivita atlantica TaxID=1317121 RepID=A0A0L1JPK8_9RHOB|nr:tRNA uridine-5-carboxymethylaminomethyl(34) synthesis GTPase MnmE [Pseudaestuariivita atlantica]KNG93699.1 tRNA modification GTPase TrmE [Pseudaestuariivita atlantica]
MADHGDTIFALASARGKAGVSVIRISGPGARDAAATLTGDLPPDREARLRVVRDAAGGRIDAALVLVFPEDHSFTGESVVELQTHGSTAVVQAVLACLGQLEGCRLAEPGEFTRRALDNNRLTLTEVEGLSDLIEAETEAQRKQADRLFRGELRARAEEWRQDLIRASALIEASIDFADEEIPDGVIAEAQDLIAKTKRSVDLELNGAQAARGVREGFEVAIVGRPNVGKSTLLNAIARRDAAIVSDIAGTTRDIVEARVDLNGQNVLFLDTAGLRESGDTIEQLGVEKARSRSSAADLRVFLGEGASELGVPVESSDIVIGAKADISGQGVSGLTGEGVAELLKEVSDRLETFVAGSSLASHERHVVALSDASAELALAGSLLGSDEGAFDLAAESIRASITALERLVGRVGIEDVYDEIFRSFCLGK